MQPIPLEGADFPRNNFDPSRLLFIPIICLVHMAELSSFNSLNPTITLSHGR
jgi:hypothetical protein